MGTVKGDMIDLINKIEQNRVDRSKDITAVAEKYLEYPGHLSAYKALRYARLRLVEMEEYYEYKGKVPGRQDAYKRQHAEKEGIAKIVDMYMAQWLYDNDYQAGYHFRVKLHVEVNKKLDEYGL